MQVTVGVNVNGATERHRRTVHRLVLLAFRGEPNDPSNHGRHLNGNRLDNRIDNLAWGSPRDNASDAIRHGTLGVGMRSRRRKLTEAEVIEIKSRRADGESVITIARDFGVHRTYIYQLMNRRCWPNVGPRGA
ncbi:HNH endonuclease [Cycloclasticus pugetii]|uniref:HNH endonuclease n=1 Tax=Cycloclasticus pugetii TaxID=34068 RepID=UPI003A8FE7C8